MLRLLIISILIIIVDQLSKFIVSANMNVGQSIDVISNILSITYVRNPGAAFGILPHQTAFLVAVSVVVIVIIMYYCRILPGKYKYVRLGLSVQLGGAIGNLIDRVRLDGHVVDFIDFTFFPPVFNIADSAIVIGTIIFLLAFWYTERIKDEEGE